MDTADKSMHFSFFLHSQTYFSCYHCTFCFTIFTKKNYLEGISETFYRQVQRDRSGMGNKDVYRSETIMNVKIDKEIFAGRVGEEVL